MTDEQNNIDPQGTGAPSTDTAPQPAGIANTSIQDDPFAFDDVDLNSDGTDTTETRSSRHSRKDKLAKDKSATPKPAVAKPALDRALTIIAAILVAALVGAIALFIYNVYNDQKILEQADAGYRMEQSIKEQIKESPDEPQLRVRLAEVYMSAGKFDAALNELSTAIKLDDKHAGAYYDTGMCYLNQEKLLQARKAFGKVLEVTAGSQYSDLSDIRENAFYAMGRLELQDKKYEDAAGYFKQALRIKKDASDSYVGLALALKGMKEYDAALAQAVTALKFDPKNAEANYIAGEIHMEQKDKISAVYYYAKAAEAQPDRQEIKDALKPFGTADQHFTAAKTALAEGKLDKARDEIIIATNLDTASIEIMMTHIEIADKLKNFEEALEVATTLKEVENDDTEADKLIKKYKALTKGKKK